MKTFLVLEPEGPARGAAAGRVVFLREKFRWLALFFAPLWLLWHRLWLALTGWLLAVVALSLAAHFLGVEPRLAAPVLWLPTLFVAFEGSELLRRKLVRKGYRETAVIVASDVEEAEERFFAAWSGAETPAGRSPPGSSPAAPPPASAGSAVPGRVVGLFPEPGVRR